VRFGLTGDVPPRSRGGQIGGQIGGSARSAGDAAGLPSLHQHYAHEVHECASCGAAVVVSDAAFCCRCGQPLRGWCPSCHAAVRGGRFCIECGEPLET